MTAVKILTLCALMAIASIGVLVFFARSWHSTTEIHERQFSVTLPGKWVTQPSLDPTRWTYNSDNGEGQLTVSLLRIKHPLDAAERRAAFEKVTKLRRQAETEPSGTSGVTLSDSKFTESNGMLRARYDGSSVHPQRHFSCLLLGTSETITVWYLESLKADHQETSSKAESIFKTIKLSN
jgi:hypothetical protein